MARRLLSNVTSRHTACVSKSSGYVQRAEARIVEILNEQHAVVHPELEARIAEAGYRDSGLNIDTHHVTTALNNLYDDDYILSESSRTRGGRVVKTIRFTDTRRRATKVTIATRRKRLLLARYQGWSQGTKRHPHGTIGPAGETAVRTAIMDSGALQPANPGAAEVNELLGTKINGALDSAGFMVPLTSGVPGPAVTNAIRSQEHPVLGLPKRGRDFSSPRQGRRPPAGPPGRAHPPCPDLPAGSSHDLHHG